MLNYSWLIARKNINFIEVSAHGKLCSKLIHTGGGEMISRKIPIDI